MQVARNGSKTPAFRPQPTMNLTIYNGIHDDNGNVLRGSSNSDIIMDYSASNDTDLMESWGYTGAAIVLGINGFLGFTLNISVIVLMCKDMQVICVSSRAPVRPNVDTNCNWFGSAVESDQHHSFQSGVLGFLRVGVGESVHDDRGHLSPVDIRQDAVRLLRLLHGSFGHHFHYHADGAIVRTTVYGQVSVHHQAAEQSRCIRIGAVHLDVLAGGDDAAAFRLGCVRE